MILEEAVNNDLLGPSFVWILSGSISLDSFDENLSHALIGMLSVEPAPSNEINGSLLTAAYELWKIYQPESFPPGNDVDPYALFTFDVTWLLIQSLQRLCPSKIDDRSGPCLPFRNSSFCFDRQLVNSTSFLEQISATTFLDVSGPIAYDSRETDRIHSIHYVTRNAQPSSKGVSFVPVLNYSDAGDWQLLQSTHHISWPGKSYAVPKGQAEISSVKLRIGVIQSHPITMARYVTDQYDENTSTIVGYIPDLVCLLQQKMKFASQLVLSPSKQNHSELIRRDCDLGTSRARRFFCLDIRQLPPTDHEEIDYGSSRSPLSPETLLSGSPAHAHLLSLTLLCRQIILVNKSTFFPDFQSLIFICIHSQYDGAGLYFSCQRVILTSSRVFDSMKCRIEGSTGFNRRKSTVRCVPFMLYCVFLLLKIRPRTLT